ncbi:MAG: hypothetical protein A2Y17_03085 [Clostridiales bacterium GWF2_38_85]|nr:MAG: hypothetical protein A2Y17_03085 [Clostridiales bacterium GWF2_38_85]
MTDNRNNKEQNFKEFIADSTDFEEKKTIANAKAGDNASFDALANKYLSLIKWVINNYNIPASERDDDLQECYIGLLKAIRTYDNISASFVTYATACIKRNLLSAIKKYKKETNNIILLDKIPNTILASPETLIIDEESTLILYNRFLGQLSYYEKKVFELYLSEKNADEIAGITGKDKKSINNAISRIKIKISKALENKNS